jgi:hypothetical protein
MGAAVGYGTVGSAKTTNTNFGERYQPAKASAARSKLSNPYVINSFTSPDKS